MNDKLLVIVFASVYLYTGVGYAQMEPFTKVELNQRPSSPSERYSLGHPFEIIYGPDNKLYITEKVGRVLQVDTGTGIRKVLLDIRTDVSLSITRNGAGQATGIGQDGMMGMALHPDFNKGIGKDSVFVAFKHVSGSIRIVRYRYNGGATPTLTGPTVLISGIPAGADHSSGRMIIGGDRKIYYTCGDLGSNQFAAKCSPIRSQDLPTAAQVSASNFLNYSGKVLRINMDGSIPDDNPVLNSVRSHVYTTGHRNPQGLVWEKMESNGTAYPIPIVGGKLYSSEHGPRTDDEVNVLEPGKNYGWPFIAGLRDNVNYRYVNWSSASATDCNNTNYTENAVPPGATITTESAAPASVTTNFVPPIFSMFPDCGSQPAGLCSASGTDWMKFATVAPSGLDHYNVSGGVGIPGWYPSLLLPTLRKGALYRVQLSSDGETVASDTIPYFKSVNRYRDIALSPDGQKIFLITDSIGATSGPSGASNSSLANRGSILVFQYTGTLLSSSTKEPEVISQPSFSVYPNPAYHTITLQFPKGARPYEYFLYDMSGRSMLQGRSSESKKILDVSTLSRGVYYLQVRNQYGGIVGNQKIILQ